MHLNLFFNELHRGEILLTRVGRRLRPPVQLMFASYGGAMQQPKPHVCRRKLRITVRKVPKGQVVHDSKVTLLPLMLQH